MLTDFSEEYARRSDDELLQLATQRHQLTEEAVIALDAELHRRKLTECDRVKHQKFVKHQERREYKVHRRKIFGKRQFSWLELLSAFAAMGAIAWAYFSLPKRYQVKTRLGRGRRLCGNCFHPCHSRVEAVVARNHVLDRPYPLVCHSVGGCACLGAASGKTEPWRRKVGYASRLRFVYCDERMYEVIAAKLLR
jgi:hypothetical protein